MTRAQAIAKGLRYYMSDTPCSRDHRAYRRTYDKKCTACDALRKREAYRRNHGLALPKVTREDMG